MHTGARTDFSRFSHEQLVAMLDSGDSSTIRSAADAWDAAGKFLHEQAGDLEQQLTGFHQKWSGGAAQQYERMITDLAAGLRTVAENAWSMRDISHDAADALDTAQARMPQPVAVPDVSPAMVALATTPIQVEAMTPPSSILLMQQRQAGAVAALQQQQQAQHAADAAHAQAVAIMTALADHYTADNDAIPATPTATAAPTGRGPDSVTGGHVAPISGGGAYPLMSGADLLPSGLDPSALGPDSLGTEQVGGGAGATKPLFGDMIAAGIAAASAAAVGRFGAVMPSLPPFARSGASRKKDGLSRRTDPAASPAAAGALGARLAGAGGGGIGGGGIGGGALGSGSGAAPSGYSSLISQPSTPAAGLGAAAAAGQVAAPGGGGSSGMMPGAMPMGGAMGAGMDGGGRRIPPWLVETEDVWGESSVVAPTVIGEEG